MSTWLQGIASIDCYYLCVCVCVCACARAFNNT